LLKAEWDVNSQVKSRVWVRKIFRGEDFGEVMTSTSYKADWKLVPRADEHKYLNTAKRVRPRGELPDAVPFPPLLNHFIMLERQQKGQPLDEPPMLPVKSVLLPRPQILPPT